MWELYWVYNSPSFSFNHSTLQIFLKFFMCSLSLPALFCPDITCSGLIILWSYFQIFLLFSRSLLRPCHPPTHTQRRALLICAFPTLLCSCVLGHITVYYNGLFTCVFPYSVFLTLRSSRIVSVSYSPFVTSRREHRVWSMVEIK